MTVETGDKAYQNAQDTLYSYLGIMRCMQDVAERQVILGEIRGDLVSSTDYTTDTLFAISNFEDPKDQSCSMLQVSDYYNVINNCNFYLHHADTSAIKSNIKYMVPEYAQVKAIRAWAYLQLVKNYGSVPFITEPISSLDVIKNFEYQANLVNKDNLIDRLLEDGLAQFVDTRYPQYGNKDNQYGSWSNGYTDISARLCFIPIRVILGDLYLLRGASESDYKKAAQYYYDFLNNEVTPLAPQYCTANRVLSETIYRTTTSWGSWGGTYYYDESDNEVVSLIPGSANGALGKMLTRVSDIYGYTPSSAQSQDKGVGDDGNDRTDANGNTEFEVAGAISVSKNWKRQFGPSKAYQGYNEAQTYVNYVTTTATPTISTIENCDARFGYSVEDFTHEGEAYPLCSKSAKGAQFFYTIPIYRKSLIWLRLAEAINRAGYPEFAFGILKDGLNQYSIPTIREFMNINLHVTEIEGTEYYSKYNADLDITVYQNASGEDATYYYYNENQEFAPYESDVKGSKWKNEMDTLRYNAMYYGDHNAMYYVTDSTRLADFNSFLDFKNQNWNSTYGIHAKGCGYGTWTSSNTGEITTNISGTRDAGVYDYATLLKAQGVDCETASIEDIINAVENIIVDELALETAFEGNRFTDLVRIAEHKNSSGYEGTEWLARKIANRNYRPATMQNAAQGAFDDAIYNKLLNTKNWYFSLPAWSVK